MANEFIVLLVGPSASGKSTIADKLEELYGWKQVQSITTRPRRSRFFRELLRHKEGVRVFVGTSSSAIAERLKKRGVSDFVHTYVNKNV